MFIMDYVCNPFVDNLCEMEYFMKKNSYELMLRIYEKQRTGERLFKHEKRWKKKYNENRIESVRYEGDIRVTRYKPAWQS